MSETTLAKIFTEWKRQYDADPEGFMSHLEFDATEPPTYGELAARMFKEIEKELA